MQFNIFIYCNMIFLIVLVKPVSWERVRLKTIQSYPTVCDPVNYTVHVIIQARILDWVVFPFSRVSSQPRDWTQVFHIAGGFFINWAMKEAENLYHAS